jgi:hypothetical protein
MKKLLGCFLGLMLMFGLSGPALADIMVPVISPPTLPGLTNPDDFSPDNPATEEIWLNGLLGNTDPNLPSWVELVWSDTTGDNDWQAPVDWTYAVLKYGGPQAPTPGLDHYAIFNDDGGMGIDFPGLGLSTHALSHVTYDASPVPEPATMLLLGSGLLGFGVFGRKRLKK